MDYGAILTNNLDIFLFGILAVMVFYTFVWIPLKLFYRYIKSK